MLTGTELGRAIEAARIRKGITKKALADHFGVSPPSVQDWVRRGTIDKERLSALWAYFSDVVGPEHWGLQRFPIDPAPGGGESSMAQSVSLRHATMRRRITWEQIMTGADLGDEFESVMEDESMMERAPRGHIVVWRTDKAPEFGKLILARDAHGRLHVRRKVQAATLSGWAGAPDNPAYASFDGDMLTIVAVARGVLEPD